MTEMHSSDEALPEGPPAGRGGDVPGLASQLDIAAELLQAHRAGLRRSAGNSKPPDEELFEEHVVTVMGRPVVAGLRPVDRRVEGRLPHCSQELAVLLVQVLVSELAVLHKSSGAIPDALVNACDGFTAAGSALPPPTVVVCVDAPGSLSDRSYLAGLTGWVASLIEMDSVGPASEGRAIGSVDLMVCLRGGRPPCWELALGWPSGAVTAWTGEVMELPVNGMQLHPGWWLEGRKHQRAAAGGGRVDNLPSLRARRGRASGQSSWGGSSTRHRMMRLSSCRREVDDELAWRSAPKPTPRSESQSMLSRMA